MDVSCRGVREDRIARGKTAATMSAIVTTRLDTPNLQRTTLMLLARPLRICITAVQGECELGDRRVRLLGHVRRL